MKPLKVLKGANKHNNALSFVAVVLENTGQSDEQAIAEAYRYDGFLIPQLSYHGGFFAKQLRVRMRTKRRILVHQECGWDI